MRDRAAGLERIRARLQEDARSTIACLPSERGFEVVGLRAELDARHVLEPHDRSGVGRVHDDLLELFGRREAPLRRHGSR